MASGKDVFLIGPGFIGREIVDLLLAESYNVTTLARREEAAKELEQAGIKARLGGLDNADIISDEVFKNDIVIHTATADHLPSVQAVIAGIQKRAAEGKSTIFIHNSGSGVLDDRSKSMFKSDKVFEDDKPADIDALPDSQPHREIDLAIVKARKELQDHAKMVIIMPPVIYGYNPKYGRLSIQIPTLTRFAIKHGYAGYLGAGEAVWNQVHVFDLARAYIILLHWLEQADPAEVLKNPYFFCENGQEFAWKDAAAEIGKALHVVGKVKSPKPKQIPEKDYTDLFGPGASDTVVGSNSRCRANRLRALGWKPRETPMYESLIQDELPIILKEKGEFQGYGRRAA